MFKNCLKKFINVYKTQIINNFDWILSSWFFLLCLNLFNGFDLITSNFKKILNKKISKIFDFYIVEKTDERFGKFSQCIQLKNNLLFEFFKKYFQNIFNFESSLRCERIFKWILLRSDQNFDFVT